VNDFVLKIYVVNAIINRYKIPFLISLVIALGIVVFGGVGNWLTAVFIFLGSILGMFFLDFEFLLNSFIVDPDEEKSVEIRRIAKNKDIKGYFEYINQNEYAFDKLMIRSVLFQILFWIFIFYVINGAGQAFSLAFTLSVGANMLYQQILEFIRTKTLRRWFWMYNGEITKKVYDSYIILMALLYVIMVLYI